MKEVIQACKNLGVPVKTFDKYANIVELEKDGKKLYFVQASTPFNTMSMSTLTLDKGFTYEFFKDKIKIPKSKTYLDPECNEKYRDTVEFKDQKEILDDIEKNFSYPLIVKMNRGSRGRNVFLCKNRGESENAISNIFDKETSPYDYIAFVQEYVDIAHEYRVIWFKGEIILFYEKASDDKSESLSPLHNESGRAIRVTDQNIIGKVNDFISSANFEESFEFLGLDIVVDKNDNIYLIELNSRPGLTYFIRDNGSEPVVKMYEILIKDLMQ